MQQVGVVIGAQGPRLAACAPAPARRGRQCLLLCRRQLAVVQPVGGAQADRRVEAQHAAAQRTLDEQRAQQAKEHARLRGRRGRRRAGLHTMSGVNERRSAVIYATALCGNLARSRQAADQAIAAVVASYHQTLVHS